MLALLSVETDGGADDDEVGVVGDREPFSSLVVADVKLPLSKVKSFVELASSIVYKTKLIINSTSL